MIPSGSSEKPLQLNTWESHALDVRWRLSLLYWGPVLAKPDINAPCNQYEFPRQSATRGGSSNGSPAAWNQLPDPMIYPGIYSASGLDVMGILVRTATCFQISIALHLVGIPRA